MSSKLKYWREAATLLLVAKTRVPSVTKYQTTNYEVLMLKRSGKSKFMPKLHVFPGGLSDDSDFSPKWLDLYGLAGNNVVNDLQNFLKRGGPGAFMFSRTRPEEFSKIPSELAFRICAIRETFEESGILIVRDINDVKNGRFTHPLSGKSSVMSETILMSWRKKVDNDASQFIKMCEELKVVPDVWSLYEWSNWLTPIIPSRQEQIKGTEKTKGRRYDTAFYLCMLDYIPEAVHDDKETTELEWASASQFLLKHDDKGSELQLAPPQILELGRLLKITDAELLKKWAYECSSVRAVRNLPIPCTCDDGVLYLNPGDDLYPENPDYEGLNPPVVVSGTMVELRDRYPRMNRSEIYMENNTLVRIYQCNIPMKDGRPAPSFDVFSQLRSSL